MDFHIAFSLLMADSLDHFDGSSQATALPWLFCWSFKLYTTTCCWSFVSLSNYQQIVGLLCSSDASAVSLLYHCQVMSANRNRRSNCSTLAFYPLNTRRLIWLINPFLIRRFINGAIGMMNGVLVNEYLFTRSGGLFCSPDGKKPQPSCPLSL